MNRQIASYEVFTLLAPFLGDPDPIVGTPDWCALDDSDPAKWAAVLWAAVWWSVAEDARQSAMCEASRAIAAAADWRDVGRPKPKSYIRRIAS